MQIGYIGLGKMGLAMVARLREKGYRVVAWNRSKEAREKARKLSAEVNDTIAGVCAKLKKPRLVWLMLPHAVLDEMLKELVKHLSKGDTVIDGGNSFYKDSMRRAMELSKKGINFLDVGTSGGPSGARNGACLMIGGDKKIFQRYEGLFRNLSNVKKIYSSRRGSTSSDEVEPRRESYAYVGTSGAGHFVKMVHNGIEYGMMQAIGEGFNLLRSADKRRYRDTRINTDKEQKRFGLNLRQIAELYNTGSVIESRLVGWLARAFQEYGEDLKDISGEAAQSGEGLWTVETAKELAVPVEIIRRSLEFRLKSKGNPSYTGQVVSALRNQFGGHSVFKKRTS